MEAIAQNEGGLHRVQGVRRTQAFDRHDLVVGVHDGERQARVDAPAVDQHRAGTALPMIAALFSAREMEMLAQRVEQRCTRVQLELSHAAVDGQRDFRIFRRVLGIFRIANGG